MRKTSRPLTQGNIITNRHVITGAHDVRILLINGTELSAQVVGIDPYNDIAVLRVVAPSGGLPPLKIGLDHCIEVGQSVLAIGNPFGLDHTLTVGVVSALGRSIPTASGGVIDGAIQIDAAINPGSSGGPLLDSVGYVIGMNTALASPTGAFSGIGFAIPVKTIARTVARILGQPASER